MLQNFLYFCRVISKENLMAKKQYKVETATPMVSEPALAYQAVPSKTARKSHKGYMTVDEYFDKVKKALDKRYENL